MEAELAEMHETNQKLTEELQAKSVVVDDRDSLQRVVRDLEEQLEALSHSERVAQQRISQLEEELKNLKTLEEVFSILLVLKATCLLLPLRQLVAWSRTTTCHIVNQPCLHVWTTDFS